MLRSVLGVLVIVGLLCACSRDVFSGSWRGKVGGGTVDLIISGGDFTMRTVDLNGKERSIEGVAEVKGDRRIELLPKTINGAPAPEVDQVALGLTLSTDGKQLQSRQMILSRQ